MFLEILNLDHVDENELNSVREKFGLSLIEVAGEPITLALEEDDNVIYLEQPVSPSKIENLEELPESKMRKNIKRTKENSEVAEKPTVSEIDEKSKSKRGRSRSQCQICGKMFAEISGSFFIIALINSFYTFFTLLRKISYCAHFEY